MELERVHNMKIGKLNFKEFAAQKPLNITPSGEFLTASEIAKKPVLSLGSLFQLDTKQQLKLAVKRFEIEPDFRLGIIGVGLLTKTEVIEHLRRQTEFGRVALRAEMGYCNELIEELVGGGKTTSWPIIPKKPIPIKPNWRPEKKCISLKLINRILFCENTTDSVTRPFAAYRAKNVHPAFKSRGYSLKVLEGTDDVKTNFEPLAKHPLTVYLSGVGHGNYNVYTGHWGDYLLEASQYSSSVVRNKAIHFLSCRTARDLGPDTIKKGAKCYAGYMENFILQWDDGSTPAVNEFELFARSDSTFDIMMANGATAQTAYSATIQAFNAARAQVPNTVAATYLTWDRDNFKLHGDGGHSLLLPYRYIRICYPLKSLEQEEALIKAGDQAD